MPEGIGRTVLALRREYASGVGVRYDLTIATTGAVRYQRSWGTIQPGRDHIGPATLRHLVDAFEAAAFARLPQAVNILCDAECATLRLFEHEVTWYGASPATAVLDRLELLVLEAVGLDRGHQR